jgi:hypothetical protein
MAAAFASALLAGCGGSSASSSSDVSSETPAQIAQSVKSAVDSASSTHMTGSVTSSGTTITLDIKLVKPGVQGTVIFTGLGTIKIATTDGSTFDVVADASFWGIFAGVNAATVQALAGKCILVGPSTPGFGQIATGIGQVTNLTSLFDTALKNTGGITKGTESTVNGQRVLELDFVDGSKLDVPTQGTPYPVKFTATGSPAGAISFDMWNSAGSITTPSGCLDISQLVAPTPS